jgi:hypothetical protein
MVVGVAVAVLVLVTACWGSTACAGAVGRT